MTLQADILWEDQDIHLLRYTFRTQNVKPSQVTNIGALSLLPQVWISFCSQSAPENLAVLTVDLSLASLLGSSRNVM